jgi:hypothetical protein
VSQIALPFDWPAPENADNFIVTAANRAAVDGVDSPARWPVRAAILTGPRKSGRSLLGRIFAAKTGGTLIDDGELHKEADVFHRWNIAQEERRPLLIVALSPPPIWKVRLADLSSRLAATPIFTRCCLKSCSASAGCKSHLKSFPISPRGLSAAIWR